MGFRWGKFLFNAPDSAIVKFQGRTTDKNIVTLPAQVEQLYLVPVHPEGLQGFKVPEEFL
jgi:hypothetical protein